MNREQIIDLNNFLDGFLIKFKDLSKDEQIEFIGMNSFLHSIYSLGYTDCENTMIGGMSDMLEK